MRKGSESLVQFIITPKGERLAVLPASEYEEMVRRLTPAATAAPVAARAGHEAKPEGVNPIRYYRERRGMTAKALGEAAGVSQGYISQIETGRRQGTLAAIARIAAALNVEPGALMSARQP